MGKMPEAQNFLIPPRTLQKSVLSTHQMSDIHYFLKVNVGAPVAQWVKRWSTDLAGRVRSSLEAKSSHRKRSFIAHSLSLSISHRADMTEILLKRT